MPAKIIDGKAIAEQIKSEISEATARLLKTHNIRPGLGFIIVGDDPASRTYVRMKGKACAAVGFHSITKELSANTSIEELLTWVDRFNQDDSIHGFLVQLPLPQPLDESRVIEAVSPEKDVDCFHPMNVGRLHLGTEAFAPCTPAGIIELLLRSGVEPAGKHAVILGRSSIVGRPLATLLSRKGRGGNATVTMCHSKTTDLQQYLKTADIVIAAMGKPEMITGEMLKPGCVVIDVGTNRIPAPSVMAGKESILVGDVHFASASQVARLITPVPGGVGPMTIAILLRNTLRAAERKAGVSL
ncbi:MAG: bifunctional 5,10-methylenetetrahydrofolate dehydrogenase/5,10-methenyltetrahydrofolate cyclohydrolase [bacterium]|nr:bifunctional 5,10-methylenetetrahydrofolate dehydrogenase/5,10-methenyltetrahydrofolate cyclohydrolase [bacterium]